MILSELFTRLALGELTNLGLAEGGVIEAGKKPQIVLHANDALKRIYTRFLLKEDTLFIDMIAGRTSYPLKKIHAQSDTDDANTAPRFINDLGRPFTEDVVKVMAVYDGQGRKFALNDPHTVLSAHTPQATLLQIPHPIGGQPLAVLYQAGHPKLTGVEGQALELPDFLEGALTAYIAYKVFTHMNTQENTVKAGEHLKTYESICIDAVEQDLVSTGSVSGELRFEKNGWL